MAIFSPSTVGRVATRMSSSRPAAAALSEMRPSCGFRRSAMSSFASTLRRVMTPAVIRFGTRCTSCMTPSVRNRTTSESACGSKCTSEAPSSAAWKMIELTSRTSGASEMPSSASRSSPASSSSSEASSSSSVSSMARAPKASAARASRLTSWRMSSFEATPSSIGRRVASFSSSIAFTFCGSAIADAKDARLDGVGDRDQPLEDVERDFLGGVGRDADVDEVDDRHGETRRERVGDPLRSREALVDERLREGAGLRSRRGRASRSAGDSRPVCSTTSATSSATSLTGKAGRSEPAPEAPFSSAAGVRS